MLVDVESAKPARQIKINLYRPALPFAANCVAQNVFKLRPIEGAFSLVHGPWPAAGLQRRDARRLSLVPDCRFADAFVRAVGEFYAHVGKTKILIDGEDQVIHPERLLGDLAFADEDMRVVLRECAHAHEPMQRPRWLKPVDLPEL